MSSPIDFYFLDCLLNEGIRPEGLRWADQPRTERCFKFIFYFVLLYYPLDYIIGLLKAGPDSLTLESVKS